MTNRLLPRLVFLLLWSLSLPAASAGSRTASICYNYGCAHEEVVHFVAAPLAAVVDHVARAANAAEERERLADAVGRLYALAAEQTPIGADRGGNLRDEGVPGRMDCIDHATSTTRLLHLIARQGGMRFHRVLEPERRVRFIFQHFSAAIEELPGADEGGNKPAAMELVSRPQAIGEGMVVENWELAAPALARARYVVDSWFVDNGEPAVVLPLVEWRNGGGPNVH